MKWSAIRREVRRDLATGSARAVVSALALLGTLAGLSAGEIASVRQGTDAAEHYRAAGAATITLSAPGRIDGAACAALAATDPITASGALRPAAEPLAPAVLPRESIPAVEVTPGVLGVLDAEWGGGPGVVLSEQVADVLGRPNGSDLVLQAGSVPVSGRYAWPADGRRPGYGYSALVPVPATGAFDECWVSAWPVPTNIGGVLRTVLIIDENREAQSQVVLSQLNTTLGARFDGGAAYADRLTRLAPWVGALLAALIGYLSVRSRRAQIAGLRHDGVRPEAVSSIIGLEVAAWVLPAAVLTMLRACIAALTGPAGADAVTMALAARVVVAGLVAAFVGAVVALATARERHLVRYVKGG